MKTTKPIRWGVELAASEFGINPRTVSSRIKTTGIIPGDDGKFSTKQIAAAVFGDIDGERLRETRAKADGLELENQRKRGEVIYVAEFVREYHSVLIGMKQIIMNSKLKEEDKNEILGNLARIQTEQDEVKPKRKRKAKA